MPRFSITVREPVKVRIKEAQVKDIRATFAETAAALIEEALDARDRKSVKK